MIPLRLGSSATSYALSLVNQRAYVGEGKCLKFVRGCFNVDAKWPDAITDWRHVPLAQRHTGHGDPPPGVPVSWDIGRHGHIALSLGGGWCVSTDILQPGRASRVRIALITSRWGAHYLGWAESINGVRVYTPAAAQIPRLATVRLHRVVSAAKHDPHAKASAALHRADVRIVERALVLEGLMDDRWVDGSWGTKTTAAWARWQRRVDDRNPAGKPSRGGLVKLGARHGFRVTD